MVLEQPGRDADGAHYTLTALIVVASLGDVLLTWRSTVTAR